MPGDRLTRIEEPIALDTLAGTLYSLSMVTLTLKLVPTSVHSDDLAGRLLRRIAASSLFRGLLTAAGFELRDVIITRDE